MRTRNGRPHANGLPAKHEDRVTSRRSLLIRDSAVGRTKAGATIYRLAGSGRASLRSYQPSRAQLPAFPRAATRPVPPGGPGPWRPLPSCSPRRPTAALRHRLHSIKRLWHSAAETAAALALCIYWIGLTEPREHPPHGISLTQRCFRRASGGGALQSAEVAAEVAGGRVIARVTRPGPGRPGRWRGGTAWPKAARHGQVRHARGARILWQC
jgi:hypothetical protein